jgi:REP element-mobilizing transposase RayT
MASDPKIYRGYGALRIGRWSQTGSDYFLTGCLHRPLTGLTTEPLASIVQSKLREIESAGKWHLRTFVLMPDHFHVLATLGPGGDLSGTVRLFKGPLTPMLRTHGLRWQTNFYDHRLRSVDEVQPTLLYIFLNPYRAGLVKAGAKWPWYYCAPEDWAWFSALTDESLPFPEWLRRPRLSGVKPDLRPTTAHAMSAAHYARRLCGAVHQHFFARITWSQS